jgi:hypothetical protein
MGIRNRSKEGLDRLASKTLDARFLHEIQHGLNCSPFEAEAVLQVVKEVYFPFIDAESPMAPPGKITLIAVSAEEPAGKPVAQCEKARVCLTLHRGAEDDRVLQRQGAIAFRRARIADLCQEALSQGGLLSNCDLAELLSTRDERISQVVRNYERQHRTVVPRRATLHDVGRAMTHKRIICYKRYAHGKTSDVIARETYHSIEAVDRYLGQYDRVRHCRRQGLSPTDTAHILDCSLRLVEEYLAIDEELESTDD